MAAGPLPPNGGWGIPWPRCFGASRSRGGAHRPELPRPSPHRWRRSPALGAPLCSLPPMDSCVARRIWRSRALPRSGGLRWQLVLPWAWCARPRLGGGRYGWDTSLASVVLGGALFAAGGVLALRGQPCSICSGCCCLLSFQAYGGRLPCRGAYPGEILLWFVLGRPRRRRFASLTLVEGVVWEVHLMSAACCGSERKLRDDGA